MGGMKRKKKENQKAEGTQNRFGGVRGEKKTAKRAAGFKTVTGSNTPPRNFEKPGLQGFTGTVTTQKPGPKAETGECQLASTRKAHGSDPGPTQLS